MKRLFFAFVVIGVIMVMLMANTNNVIVKTGDVALVINHFTGKVDPNIRHAGFNPMLPFSGNELLEIPTYSRTYTMVRESMEGSQGGDDSVLVNTLSANTLNVDTSITYHIAFEKDHPDRLVTLYNKYRNQFTNFSTFEEAQMRPAFRQAVVDAFGLASTSDNMTGEGKRKAAAYALEQLNRRFAPDSVVIDEVRIRTIYPDNRTVTALRSRLAAQQNLSLSKLNQKLQQLVNQKTILAAEAQAKAAHIQAASLTPRLVKSRHIKDLEIVGVPRGAIINLPSEDAGQPASRPNAGNGEEE
jgi:regulator of protease activity HflC (stomatin/prohibitin superfamily)